MALMDIFKSKPKAPPAPPMGMPAYPSSAPSEYPSQGMYPSMAQPAMPGGEIPISQVVSMQQQGLSNNQIIEALQRQGFMPQQIYDALAQAEAKQSIEPMAHPVSESAMKFEKPGEHPAFEEVAESIIEEKWGVLQKDLAKFSEWKDSMTSRMDRIEQSVNDTKGDLDGLHKAIVARIGDYDKTLMDVGTEIKAMEKVFQKVLPELTGNIQELSKITKTVKGKK